MQVYEYHVIPAPKRGLKAKGIKGAPALFANALAKLMNEQAAEGWEYLRADTLPAEERQGLTGKTTVYQNMLVFRRAIAQEPQQITPPEPVLAEFTIPIPVPIPHEPDTFAEAPEISGTPMDEPPALQTPELRAEEKATAQ